MKQSPDGAKDAYHDAFLCGLLRPFGARKLWSTSVRGLAPPANCLQPSGLREKLPNRLTANTESGVSD